MIWWFTLKQVARCELEDHLNTHVTVHLNLLCGAITQIYSHLNLSPGPSQLSAGQELLDQESAMSPAHRQAVMSSLASSIGHLSLESAGDAKLLQRVSGNFYCPILKIPPLLMEM